LSLKQFLSGCLDLKDAKQKVEQFSLVGLSDEEILFTLDEINNDVKPPSKSTDTKVESKNADTKTKKAARKRTTRRRRVKKDKSKESSSKGEDSSYFETWKVPYVEPE
jgi:hypothetical protein